MEEDKKEEKQKKKKLGVRLNAELSGSLLNLSREEVEGAAVVENEEEYTRKRRAIWIAAAKGKERDARKRRG